MPTLVHSVNSTSTTSSGSTQIGLLRHRSRWCRVERWRVAPERIEEPHQPGELGVGEPGADPPGEAELSIVFIDAEEQRT